jgi:hypothetical protein
MSKSFSPEFGVFGVLEFCNYFLKFPLDYREFVDWHKLGLNGTISHGPSAE